MSGLNRDQRKPFLDLLPLIKEKYDAGHLTGSALCELCRHAEYDWSEMDGRSYFNCCHPIEAISYSYDKYPDASGDCWGFSPHGKIDECRRFLIDGVWDWQVAYVEAGLAEERARKEVA